MATSKFSGVENAPPIEVFALTKAYTEDPFLQKVNLGVGGNCQPNIISTHLSKIDYLV